MAEEYGILTINSERGGTVVEIRGYLSALENAYNNLYAFDIFVTRAQQIAEEQNERSRFSARTSRPNFRILKPFKNVENLVLPEDRLRLVSIVIQSPGFWEFLGALNPLETLRKYLNDRHEQRKDREYREPLEHDKMALENAKLRNEVLQGQIDLMRSIGMSEEQIRQALAEHVFKPLALLDPYYDSRLIERASVREIENP